MDIGVTDESLNGIPYEESSTSSEEEEDDGEGGECVLLLLTLNTIFKAIALWLAIPEFYINQV